MTETRQLAGFKGPKADVLAALKQAQPLTAGELAERFGLTANALRRHLKDLEADGLVAYQRENRGVGQPVFAYRLTPAAHRLFPNSHDEALSTALALIRSRIGSDAVVEVFRSRWAAIAERARPELDGLPLAERARRLAEILSSLGYMAEAGGDDGSILRERHCTIRAVVDQFPEVCIAEEQFIQDVLGAEVRRHAHIAKGANCCEYCIAEPTGLRHAASGTDHHPPAPTSRLQETS
ncbi:MAG: helix-turn-helix domain-containing protein [Gemmatimonadaceae bacterium]|nr:helix-turn-helix domain-containing protein [Gemmatimonadaceae bacterium]